MRWFSSVPQIPSSRPVATIEQSRATRASILMKKSIAIAAASKAGPRLADVAGSARVKDREFFAIVAGQRPTDLGCPISRGFCEKWESRMHDRGVQVS